MAATNKDAETFTPLMHDDANGISLKDADVRRDSRNSRASRGSMASTDRPLTNFIASKGLTSAEAERRLIEFGRNELQDKKTPKVGHQDTLFLQFSYN